ncbi:MAG: phosphate ABC transporter permease PstA [Deltaproteobacteria bacterium]|nr:phosphate ABC transporter permease PstA [Deltaproteobacteria bacterium]MBN2670214.1 phosphate ABC transporter permease PstA [Deltaproteobacteria bacterium]
MTTTLLPRNPIGRKILDKSVKGLSVAASLLGIFFLGWILMEVTNRGIAAINWDFFTELPAPPGEETVGLSSAIVGTLLMTVIAVVVGVPVGILSGVFLSEVARGTRLANAIRFCINVLMGVPSIIIGLFVYTILVLPLGQFSGFAGAISLAVIMLPVVARTTDDMLVLVPNALRESALALGTPKWRVTFDIVLRAAKTGMTTGVLLAIARVSGETAPLLFTSLNSVYMPESLMEPTSNLTVTIFNYAMSPYADWQQMAWGASLLIMISVLSVTIFARAAFKERTR